MKSEEEIVKSGIKIGIIVLFVLILIFGTPYQVKEQEQAVLVTFGEAKAVTDPGLHFKIPLIQKVKKIDTTIKGLAIGYIDTQEEKKGVFDSLLSSDTEEHVEVPEESLMITSDYNFVNVDFFVEYRVSDPVKYTYASQEPVAILKNIAQSCIRSTISSYTVDDVLTTGKNEIQAEIKERIIATLDKQNIGLQLVNITIQDSEPPTTEVMEAFKAVETAKQGKETALNNANKYRNEQLPQAKAKADGIVKDAEAQKTRRINDATAQVARFNAMYEEYMKNPEMTRKRMYYETMEDILPGLKIIVQGSESNMQTIYPIESFK